MSDLYEPAQGRRSEPIPARVAEPVPRRRTVDSGLLALILLIGVPVLLYCILSAAR